MKRSALAVLTVALFCIPAFATGDEAPESVAFSLELNVNGSRVVDTQTVAPLGVASVVEETGSDGANYQIELLPVFPVFESGRSVRVRSSITRSTADGAEILSAAEIVIMDGETADLAQTGPDQSGYEFKLSPHF
jgi:hypothetical protein